MRRLWIRLQKLSSSPCCCSVWEGTPKSGGKNCCYGSRNNFWLRIAIQMLLSCFLFQSRKKSVYYMMN